MHISITNYTNNIDMSNIVIDFMELNKIFTTKISIEIDEISFHSISIRNDERYTNTNNIKIYHISYS